VTKMSRCIVMHMCLNSERERRWGALVGLIDTMIERWLGE